MMTNDEFIKLYPCWCGRPAVEVVSTCTEPGEAETKGYCHLHSEKAHKVIDRERQEPQ